MAGRTHVETVAATTTIKLGEAAPGRVGRWEIQYEGQGSDDWDISFNTRSVGDGTLTATAKSFWDLVTGAMSVTQPDHGTSTVGHVLLDSTGQDCEIAITVTAGSVKISAASVEG